MVTIRNREVDFDYEDSSGEDPYKIYYDGEGNLVVEHKNNNESWKFDENGNLHVNNLTIDGENAATESYVNNNTGNLTATGYEDLSGNRSVNTTYKNETGSPIDLRVTSEIPETGDSNGFLVRLYAGETLPDTQYSQDYIIEEVTRKDNASYEDSISVSAIIPDGWEYKIDIYDIDGLSDILIWKEQELKLE